MIIHKALLIGLFSILISDLALAIDQPTQQESSVSPEEFVVAANDSYKVAQRRRGRKSRRSRSSRRRGSSPGKVAEGIKGNFGFVNGDGTSEMVVGGDYVMSMKKLIKSAPSELSLVPGFTFWSAEGVTALTLEGGADYHWGINRRLRFFAGGRLVFLKLDAGSRSDTSFFLQPDAGMEYRIKRNMSAGGEFRLSLDGDYDVTLLLGFFKYKF